VPSFSPKKSSSCTCQYVTRDQIQVPLVSWLTEWSMQVFIYLQNATFSYRRQRATALDLEHSPSLAKAMRLSPREAPFVSSNECEMTDDGLGIHSSASRSS
jgi:hypothetical protein